MPPMSGLANHVGCEINFSEIPDLDDFVASAFSHHNHESYFPGDYYLPEDHHLFEMPPQSPRHVQQDDRPQLELSSRSQHHYQHEVHREVEMPSQGLLHFQQADHRQPEMPSQSQHFRTEFSSSVRKQEDVPRNSIETATFPVIKSSSHLNGYGNKRKFRSDDRNSPSVPRQAEVSPRYTPSMSPKAGEKVQRPRLTESQKKHNHNISETRRREHIKRSYDRIAVLVPGCEEKARTEHFVLDGAEDYIRGKTLENYDLVRQCQEKNITVDTMTLALLNHYEEVREDKDLMEATMAAPTKGNKLPKRKSTAFEQQWKDLPGSDETKRPYFQKKNREDGLEGDSPAYFESEASGTDSNDGTCKDDNCSGGNEVQGHLMTNGWGTESPSEELQDPTDPQYPQSLLLSLLDQGAQAD